MPTLSAGHSKGSPSGGASSGPGSNSSGTCSSSSPTGSGMVIHPHPYRHPLLPGNYNDDDFPLRKTGTHRSIPIVFVFLMLTVGKTHVHETLTFRVGVSCVDFFDLMNLN